jgi:hypothetical protein
MRSFFVLTCVLCIAVLPTLMLLPSCSTKVAHGLSVMRASRAGFGAPKWSSGPRAQASEAGGPTYPANPYRNGADDEPLRNFMTADNESGEELTESEEECERERERERLARLRRFYEPQIYQARAIFPGGKSMVRFPKLSHV